MVQAVSFFENFMESVNSMKNETFYVLTRITNKRNFYQMYLKVT